MLQEKQEEQYQLRARRAYDNWLRNNPLAASLLADVCSTNAGAGGGSSATVCGIDSASSLVDVCNTNDKEAFKTAARENSIGNKKGFGRGRGSPGQRGRGANGRPAATTPRTSFDDSDEEAFKTPWEDADGVISYGEDGWWEERRSI